MADEQDLKGAEPGPDEMKRWLGETPDEADTEGHKKLVREGEPDEVARGKGGAKDDDDPGPDNTRFSDRNRKVGIVPVEW